MWKVTSAGMSLLSSNQIMSFSVPDPPRVFYRRVKAQALPRPYKAPYVLNPQLPV